MTTPSWYSLRILNDVTVEGGASDFCEETVVVLQASSEAEAREKGKRFGDVSRTTYLNDKGENVLWAFREILEVVELSDGPTPEGWEVASHMIDRPAQ